MVRWKYYRRTTIRFYSLGIERFLQFFTPNKKKESLRFRIADGRVPMENSRVIRSYMGVIMDIRGITGIGSEVPTSGAEDGIRKTPWSRD